MSDLICRKTMMRCQTPGMCSPFGGCTTGVLVESDVRYASDAKATPVTLGALPPGIINQADHDRIVSELVEGGRKMQAERDQWQREAIRLATAICTIGKMEFDQLTDDTKLIEVMSVIREAIQERDRLAERCRELEGVMLRTYQAAGMGVNDLQTAMEDCPLDIEVGGNIREAEKEAKALRAKVERLRKDAERYRSQFGAGGWDYHESWIGQKKDFVDAEIDAALEVSR